MSGRTEAPDSKLVAAFQSGSLHVFDELVVRHQNRVFNLCFRILGHYEDADDCTQETFIKVYRSLAKFRFRSAFSTWLYRIAVNTCKNRLASAGYRSRTVHWSVRNGKSRFSGPLTHYPVISVQ
jgi:RNA polymerase sigma-70 factor (ECF subfamily)